MAFSNIGIYMLGQSLQGNTIRYPSYISLSEESYVFDANKTQIGSEILRIPISWSSSGLYAMYEAILTTSEAIGSTINSEYITDDVEIGSGNIWFEGKSIIGTKTALFDVIMEGEIYMQRPE